MLKRLLASLIVLLFVIGNTSSVWAANAINWGLSYNNGLGNPPSGPQTAEQLAQYGAYYMGSPSEKIIYLTFDCGYENGYTASILDTLKKHHTPAAFFVVGHYLDSAPDLTRRMAEEGHLVCNHSVKHPNMTKISNDRMKKELLDLEAQYFQLTGQKMAPFFRPPEGAFNVNTLQQAQSLGYHVTLWSVAHNDWDPKKQPSYTTAMNTVTSRSHNGAIILLHAVSATNAEILDELLTTWENQGYRFEALSSLPGIENPTVTAKPNENPITVDGKTVPIRAFTIFDTNYVKLRDVAAALSGTEKSFSVSYDATTGCVELKEGESYIPAGGELAGPADVAAIQTNQSNCKILKDGIVNESLQCYMIDQVNYIKLRDIGTFMDFGVSWDGASNTVEITTK